MKLIITGSSGFVATELIRQSLNNPKITSVVALARRPISPPLDLATGSDPSKFHSVVIDDYGSYSEDVKRHFIDADACIWTVAITPTKSKAFGFEEVRRICQDSALEGLKVMFEAREGKSDTATPFRFVYMSGTTAERDQSKTPKFMPEYALMRGEAENRALAYAAETNGKLEVCAAKPGYITAPGDYLKTIMATGLKWIIGVPNVDVTEVSAAMLDQIINGFEKEPLQNDDLVRIGRRMLKIA